MATQPEFVTLSEMKTIKTDQENPPTSQFDVAEPSLPNKTEGEEGTIVPSASLTAAQQAILAKIVEIQEAIAESGEDSARGQALTQVLLSFRRLWKVRSNIENRSDELKKHYFRVFKERNVYFKKLRMIEYYGEEHEWNSPEDGGLLQQIHQHLNQQKS